MPSGVFKPYAWVPTKKDWFYHIGADEFSLDDKRTFTDGKGDMLHYSSKVSTSNLRVI
jgi:type I restriction enzyme M protein